MPQPPRLQLGPGDVLIGVDVQNDFPPGGKPPVREGNEIIPALNRIVAAFQRRGLPIYALRD